MGWRPWSITFQSGRGWDERVLAIYRRHRGGAGGFDISDGVFHPPPESQGRMSRLSSDAGRPAATIVKTVAIVETVIFFQLNGQLTLPFVIRIFPARKT